jgi:hypothetical protein
LGIYKSDFKETYSDIRQSKGGARRNSQFISLMSSQSNQESLMDNFASTNYDVSHLLNVGNAMEPVKEEQGKTPV